MTTTSPSSSTTTARPGSRSGRSCCGARGTATPMTPRRRRRQRAGRRSTGAAAGPGAGWGDGAGEMRALSRLPSDMLERLVRLPSTSGSEAPWPAAGASEAAALAAAAASAAGASSTEIGRHAVGVEAWRTELGRGRLPTNAGWPREDAFSAELLAAMAELDMARFCSRNRELVDTLLRNVLELYHRYLEAVADAQEEEEPPSGREGGDKDAVTESMLHSSEDSSASGAGSSDDEDTNESTVGEDENRDGNMQRSQTSEVGDGGEEPPERKTEEEILEDIAREFVSEFKEEWRPSVEAMETAEEIFGDSREKANLLEGFSPDAGLWHKSGWRELDALRRRLARLKELRDLVRSLGRGVGVKGPLQRARAQDMRPRAAAGVVRDEREPSEVRGLTQSSDLSRMVPAELQLVAAGKKGVAAARRLHMVRRAERKLLSYERSGWLEEDAVTLSRLEVRPLADSGPIIVCLDTSSSMAGTREQVAKAVVLEAMRSAHTQQRSCYLYAFSGESQVQQFELSFDRAGMERLLDFLMYSFEGGTSVEEVLQLSLRRIESSGWETADILLVTDGELPKPAERTLAAIREASARLGLEVHGVLLGDRLSPMKEICTPMCLHTFKSWYALDGM